MFTGLLVKAFKRRPILLIVLGIIVVDYLVVKILQLRSGISQNSQSPNVIDYDSIIPRASPDSPGELNKEVIIDPGELSPEERQRFEEGLEMNGFSQYVSDMISVRRRLPDFREETCLKGIYSDVANFPDVSVVIAVYDECWSALVRTVHSILDNSPQQLIKEIILAVDYSEHGASDQLGKRLDDYMTRLGKVKVVRAVKRLGVTRTRLLGYKAAAAKVLIFLDSHCECTQGWLEPLLDRVVADRTICAVPVIDSINSRTFTVSGGISEHMLIGGFDWAMNFDWLKVPEEERKRNKYSTDPVRSPTIPRGMFAMDREFFTELGGYDPGHESALYGVENMELSFKIWMCGGSIEVVPCSRIAHIFREKLVYIDEIGEIRLNNYRVAEVWLQEYKKYFYQIETDKNIDYGDISHLLENRKKCKSFEWYIKTVYPSVFLPHKMLAIGEIRSKLLSKCLAASQPENRSAPPVITKCQLDIFDEYWYLTPRGEIMRGGECLDYSGHVGHVVLRGCHGQGGNQAFKYRQDGTIQHLVSGLCLAVSPTSDLLETSQCEGEDNQLWLWNRNHPVDYIT